MATRHLDTPMVKLKRRNEIPVFDELRIKWRGHTLLLPYLYREGAGGPAILFVHGLGGSKENFYLAFQSPALADCTLVTFDLPGTGLAEFNPTAGLDVSALSEIAQEVAAALLPGSHWLAGASMGGLIALLQFRRSGLGRVRGFINLEGNLCPEDCMFSRRVIPHTLESFASLYEQMIGELRSSSGVGDQIIAQNMALNLDMHAYYAYSFQTVEESDSGRLLQEFLSLRLPRLFLYGERNKALSYIPQLRSSGIQVREIPSAAHFLFYDNPIAVYQAIGDFVYSELGD
jgi:pimeloyl-ACP methyl ester carboxylesterase